MSALHPCSLPQKKIKQTNKQMQASKQTKNPEKHFALLSFPPLHHTCICHSGLGALGCHKCTLFKQLYLQMFIAVSYWSGSSPLASGTPSILDLQETPLGYPAVALRHGDPAAMVL